MNLYRHILKQSLISTWRHKSLWFFGLFASLLGITSNYEVIVQALDTVSGQNSFNLLKINLLWQQGLIQAFSWSNMSTLAAQDTLNTFLAVLTIILVIVILAIFIWLAVTSANALIFSAAKIQKGGRIQKGEAWQAGLKKFWPVLSIYILAKISILLLLFVISIPMFYYLQNASLLNIALYIILFTLLVIASLTISFLSIYAAAYAVIKKQSFGQAIISGFKLFKNNWLISLETAIILLFLDIIFSLLFAVGIFLLSIPFSLILFGFSYLSFKIGFIASIIAGIAGFFVLVIAFNSFLTTFHFFAWTNLFLRLQRKYKSKIERVANQLLDKIKK